MRQITKVKLLELLTDHESPCISLYMPTHRSHPENQQDPIRYRNMLRSLETSLSEKYDKREVQTLLEKFERIAKDAQFWNHRTEGLAIFASSEMFQIFDLQRSVKELLVVADSFHTKPLLRQLQSADRFQVLSVNRHTAKLYEGNRDGLDEIELADGVPRTLEDALGDELTEPHLTVGSYGGGLGGPAMHHGHGQKKDEVDLDNERFFRVIAAALLEHHSRPSGLPMILAALPEHHSLFRKVSRNPFLLDEGIEMDPQGISMERLRAEAWRLMEPKYKARLASLVAEFQEAQSKQLGAADLTDVAQALVAGRIRMLLVEADRQIPGKLDVATGRIEFTNLGNPDVDDLLDDLAEQTLKRGGDVVIVPADQMPTHSGLAAIFRF